MKKSNLSKSFLILSSVFLFTCLFFVEQASAFAGGDGSEESPWQITTPAELASLSSYLGSGHSDKHFVLMNDIDLDVSPYNTGTGWTPIGTSGSNFYGTFDGGGYTISNLFINRTASYGGLFGYTNGADISDITLSDVDITTTATYIGGLIGRAYNGTTTDTITVSGTISSSSNYVGGVIGSQHTGSATNLASSVVVSGASYVGGVFGEISASSPTNPTISDSYATGNIRGNTYTGGFVGYKVYGALSNSYATGDILGDKDGGLTNEYAGGFAGLICYGSITGSYATGDVYGDDELGGFGSMSHNCSGTSITNSYARGDVYPSESGTGGGFMRYNYLATVQKNYSTGSVDGQTNAGFIYWDVGCGGCSSNYWDKETSGQTTGGLFAGGGATGKTTLEMKDQDTFSGWDFDDVWTISAGVNDGYPYLQWQAVDVTSPTIDTLSPTDNATNVATNSNLVITFSELVDAESGNISLYKSDNTLVEQFDVTSDISGSGSTTITINPTDDLDEQTSYYVQIDATAFDDAYSNSFAGISDETTWNFTTADETAPVLSGSSPSGALSSNTTDTTLSVTTDENATCKYSDTSGTAFASMTAFTSTGGTTHTASISNLTSNRSYSYYALCRDNSSNESTEATISFSIDQVTNGFVALPPIVAVGLGKDTHYIPLGEETDIGLITADGINLLTYIYSSAFFIATASNNGVPINQQHKLTITEVDLFNNIVTIIIESEIKKVSLNLNDTILVDIDNDNVNDISISFADLVLNRIELAIKAVINEQSELPTLEDKKPPYEGQLIKYMNEPQVYLISNGNKHWIVDEETFVTKGYSWTDIEIISNEIEFPDGENIVANKKINIEFTKDLERGSEDEEVVLLQRWLNNHGFMVAESGPGSPGEETTYFGPATATALKAFQRSMNLPALGYFGPLTRSAITSY